MIPLFFLFDFIDWLLETPETPILVEFLKGIWGGMMGILRFIWLMGEILFWLIQEPIYIMMASMAFIFIFALSARNIITWWRYVFRNSNRVYEGFSEKFERMYNMALALFRFLRELSPI